MKLIVLGSNGYRPTDLGQTACYAIPEWGESELDSAYPIFPRTEVAYDGMEIEF
jgi:hypothetical protein